LRLREFTSVSGLIVLFVFNSASGAFLPGSHRVDAAVEKDARLPSNSVIDIIPHGSSLWLGTGQGLAELHLDSQAPGGGWSVIDEADGIGHGGVSALMVNDTVIWAATAYSENTDFGWKSAGGGVGFSSDSGETWTWFPQPVDDPNEDRYSPTTTNIQNVTYDIALSDSAVWIASYGGGLRKLPYGSDEWVVVPPDTNDFSALRYLNHRGFSVIFFDGALYVGTAQGVNRSTDEGATWTNYRHVSGNDSTISGDFVTALAVQETGDGHYIWAATWKAEGGTEFYGVSVSDNDGQSWRVALSDSTLLPTGEYLIDKYGLLKAHNFGFKGDTVYVAADKGLWRSVDRGYNWGDVYIESVYDADIGERLQDIDFFSVAPVGDSLWVGTNDGLAVGRFDVDAGEYVWRIHRAHRPAGRGGELNTYAYPNPFSPLRGHVTRFQVPVYGRTDVSYSIYNFAMEEVYKSGSITLPGGGVGGMEGYGSVIWDGRDARHKTVANGVYFYRIKVGGNSWWGKIMVLD